MNESLILVLKQHLFSAIEATVHMQAEIQVLQAEIQALRAELADDYDGAAPT